ncbi:bacillithiol biosynthesis cysteine-adding enzyme BshC [Hazenella coriacea]|uniref:Putative cysteine ligase BshC n=1 Tax=Hazenella coriacea TaxID=1179467 RepID=A0A4R3L6E5_9BACL|nr:bacillithiol biosynthesis cysteine-adding enzyme BshC [Hazenella coriacea]TCS94638.1 bacillithiol biosynthesis cysteine-adding enzyme BshC [Hazenella coriacea]
MKIEEVSCLQLSPFAREYYTFREPVSFLYPYDPWDGQSFVQRSEVLVQNRWSASRESLVELMKSYYDLSSIPQAIEKQLERLNQLDSLVVIGGQQAGILTGPLYTIHKAVTIIQLAQREEQRLGRPVIPVFWIAGEDHDYDEVDHVWIQDEQDQPRKVRYKESYPEKWSVSRLVLEPESLHAWLDELATLLPDREYKKEWLLRSKQLITKPTTWSDYFATWISDLFAEWGLLVIDSGDPQLRRIEAPFFKQMIINMESIQQKVREASKLFKKWGYAEPVDLKPNQAHLFIEIDHKRLPLFKEADRWMTREGEAQFTTQELINLVEEEPERFSNNVLTRPLMQEYLFPTLAFVGGPGEIAYWGLLKETFETMGLQMPILYPRLQFTFMDRRLEKRMQEFSLSWSDLFTQLTEKKEQWLQQQHNLDLDALFAEVKQKISEVHQPLIQTLDQEIGMNLRDIGVKNMQKIEEQIQYLHLFAQKAIELKYQTTLRHWEEIALTCFPNDQPQERVYNLIQIWNQYGLDWIELMLNTPLIQEDQEHKHYCIIF